MFVIHQQEQFDFLIKDIHRIQSFMPQNALVSLANVLVPSWLEYCNSLIGITESDFHIIQMAQKSFTRAITKTTKYQHITPSLHSLHYLPVQQTIQFKICLIVHKALHLNQPTYLSSLLTPYTSTQSMDTLTLAVPHTQTVLGIRAFSVADPRLWNSLPWSVSSLLSFYIV